MRQSCALSPPSRRYAMEPQDHIRFYPKTEGFEGVWGSFFPKNLPQSVLPISKCTPGALFFPKPPCKSTQTLVQ